MELYVDRNDFAVFMLLFLLNLVLVFYQPLYHVLFIDEGQYLLVSKKMIEGWVPYRDIIENKPPGMYISVIPAVLLCGNDIAKLRVYTAFMVSLTIFLVYLIGKKLSNRKGGFLAAAIMIFINAFPGFCGYVLMTDPVANLFIAAMFYCLVCFELSYSVIFLVSILFAAACSVRQTCIFMIIPVIYELYNSGKKLEWGRSAAVFAAGLSVILVPMVIYLFMNSALQYAFYWMFLALVGSKWQSISDVASTWVMMAILFLPFVLLTVIGLRRMNKKYITIFLWLLSGLIIALMGWGYWHNYLFAVPALSILASRGVENVLKLKGKMKKEIFTGIIIFIIFMALLFLAFEFYVMGGMAFSPSWEEQKGISDFIRANTQRDDRIFVFGVNSEVYYLSDRDPATRMSFFGGYVCNMSKEEDEELVFNPLRRQNTKYFVINHPNIADMCGNGSRIEREAMEYVDASYVYVDSWGPLDLYERMGSTT